MPCDRLQSITLPRNFTFHYYDGNPPRTPEPEPQPEELRPPSPPRQTYRIRRRRTAFNVPDAAALEETPALDRPIPTIEAPDQPTELALALPEPSLGAIEGFLAPAATMGRFISPPRTPEAQMMKGIDHYCGDIQPWGDMDRPINITNCDDKYKLDQSPLHGRQQPPTKRFKMHSNWTDDMDRHLWMTYNKYLQDPTVTPFKVPPGKIPPNGVCHRVARMAKKTWKGPRSLSLTLAASRRQSRAGTPDTIKPVSSGSCTPIAGFRRPYSQFPSQAEARKRLRYLCKHQPSLSAHYQRLLDCKSSSPPSSPQAAEPARPTLSSPFCGEVSSFSTRDMNLSLATSTAASMQFGNPLSQLANDGTPRAPAPPRHEDWGNMRASAHQKSQSLHIGLGIGNMFGSSFAAMSQMTGQSLGQHAAQTWHAPSNHPRLDPPLELHSPMPLPRPFKRRALHNFEDHAPTREQTLIDQLFGAPAEISHRRVRSRGFSLGDVGEGARQLSSMFTPPPNFANHTSIQNLSAALHAHDNDAPPQGVNGPSTIRLGSPFGGRSSNVQPNNTFPRTTTSYGFEAPASFEQRFAGLPSDPEHLAHN